jgi:hypothetical protein
MEPARSVAVTLILKPWRPGLLPLLLTTHSKATGVPARRLAAARVQTGKSRGVAGMEYGKGE